MVELDSGAKIENVPILPFWKYWKLLEVLENGVNMRYFRSGDIIKEEA
jgi:hypothetical protein